MGEENDKQDNLKIVFSLISLFLMLPPLINGNDSYYRTLFIFLINRVIDMFFKKANNESQFLVVWSLINQWISVVACAIAFCSIEPDFVAIFKMFSNKINIALFVSAISCVLKEMVTLIIVSIRERLIKDKIKSDMKGESL